jgi:hypothetical protein
MVVSLIEMVASSNSLLCTTTNKNSVLVPQGLAVIFSYHQVCIKKKKGGHLGRAQKRK